MMIKEISWTQLRKMDLKAIREGPCLKVPFGKHGVAFYVVVSPEEVMKDRVDAICQQIDISRGR